MNIYESINLNGNELKKFSVWNVDTLPFEVIEGGILFETASKKFFFGSDSKWSETLGDTYMVKVSEEDDTPGYLPLKLFAGNGIKMSIGTVPLLDIEAVIVEVLNHNMVKVFDDTDTANYIDQKLTPGDNVSMNIVESNGVYTLEINAIVPAPVWTGDGNGIFWQGTSVRIGTSNASPYGDKLYVEGNTHISKNIRFGGSFTNDNVTVVSLGDYTLAEDDYIIMHQNSPSANINLGNPSADQVGRILIIKNLSGINDLTVTGSLFVADTNYGGIGISIDPGNTIRFVCAEISSVRYWVKI